MHQVRLKLKQLNEIMVMCDIINKSAACGLKSKYLFVQDRLLRTLGAPLEVLSGISTV